MGGKGVDQKYNGTMWSHGFMVIVLINFMV